MTDSTPADPTTALGPASGLSSEATGATREDGANRTAARASGTSAGVAALGVAVLAAAAGVPFGLLWAVLAPAQPLIKVDGGLSPAVPEPEQFAAGDGWFTLLGLAAGALVALATWWLARRYRGPLIMFALAVGGTAGGVLAWWIGHRIGLADFREALAAAQPGTRLDRPPDLRVKEFRPWPPRVRGVLLIEALGAVVTYTLLAGWARHANLHGGPVSSGSAAPPDQTAVPELPAPDEAVPPRG